MSTIVLRSTKGSALTFAEGDANFSNLNNDKLEDITNESIGDLSDVDITNNTDGNVLTYNSVSGNLELQTLPSSGIQYSDISVGAEGSATGGGSLSYDDTTGTFTFSPADLSSYLTSYTETDPVVGAISGIVKADGAGNISAAVAGTDYVETESFTALSQDLAPELGGNLILGSYKITNTEDSPLLLETSQGFAGSPDTGISLNTGGGQYIRIQENLSDNNISISSANGTTFNGGKLQNAQLEDYKETVYTIGSNDSPSIDVANGNVQTVTITSGLTIPDISNFDTGATVTLIVYGDGSATDGTTGSICEFANAGNVTLTSKSIVSIFNDGTNYLVSIATDFVSA